MANYPTSVSTDANLYVAVNNKSTTLNGAINAAVTTITVASTTEFPATGYITIESEAISYTSTNATQFLGCTRGADGTTAATHADLTFVFHNVVAAHHNVLKDEVIAIETALGTNLSAVVQTTGTQSIAGSKTFTDPITQNDTSNQIVLGVTNTTTLNATAPAASRTVTIPDPGANASFVMTEGTQTINGSKTLGAALAMGTNKITGLGNGTAAQDAVAFTQLKIIQIVTATSTTAFSTTSNSFQTTNLSASITPTSSSNKILIYAFSGLRADGTADVTATLARGGTNILASSGQCYLRGQTGTTSGANAANAPATLGYLDSPATTSSTTYAVQIKNSNNTTSVSWGDASTTQFIALVEVVA
jgi:hypothetical protein